MKDYLNTILNYNPQTGEITWKVHLKRTQTQPGKIAGCVGSMGYRHIRITFDEEKKGYRAHRIAWLLMTGSWPVAEIDHINGIKDDNRWSNLRAATSKINSRNRKLSARNTSGRIGVCFIKANNQWRVFSSKKYFGQFNTKKEAFIRREQVEILEGNYGPNHGT